MHKTSLAAASLAGAFACVLSSAEAGTLIPVPQVPGSTATYIAGINDNNVIAGDYSTADGALHGFVGTLDGNYATFDAPNANGHTFVSRIDNAGYVTVLSNFATQECQVFGCQYVRAPGGTLDVITRHGAPIDGIPESIIGHQKFVGQYTFVDQNYNTFFYGYYGKGTQYHTGLTLPFNTDRTSPRGINGAGTVVGYFRDLANGNDYPGFVLKDGVATAVRYPDPSAVRTLFEAVNRSGMVSGYWTDANVTFGRAFLFDTANNAFSPISIAGATMVQAGGINKAGVVTIEADNLPYIYCTQTRGCPDTSSAGAPLAEKWIPATRIQPVVCRNGCLGPQHAVAAIKPANAAAARAAIARDPDIQRELRLPLHP
jgi:hypothetical protein